MSSPLEASSEPHSTSIPLADSIEGATYDDQHGGWKYPSDVSVPNVAFAVGDKYYTIHPDDFGFGSAGDGYILGGIQSRGDMNYDIFGDVFLKCVYVVCESPSIPLYVYPSHSHRRHF